jgi:hypothetical protein
MVIWVIAKARNHNIQSLADRTGAWSIFVVSRKIKFYKSSQELGRDIKLVFFDNNGIIKRGTILPLAHPNVSVINKKDSQKLREAHMSNELTGS